MNKKNFKVIAIFIILICLEITFLFLFGKKIEDAYGPALGPFILISCLGIFMIIGCTLLMFVGNKIGIPLMEEGKKYE